MNTHAQDIREQLKKVYSYADTTRIVESLRRNEINFDIPTKHLNFGYDQSEDKTLAVIYYQDGSMLKVSSTGIEASHNERLAAFKDS